MKNNMLLSTLVVIVKDNRYLADISECNLAYLSGTHSLGTSLNIFISPAALTRGIERGIRYLECLILLQ
jgi:hypothetical protein